MNRYLALAASASIFGFIATMAGCGGGGTTVVEEPDPPSYATTTTSPAAAPAPPPGGETEIEVEHPDGTETETTIETDVDD
jgi:hypothetical protein